MSDQPPGPGPAHGPPPPWTQPSWAQPGPGYGAGYGGYGPPPGPVGPGGTYDRPPLGWVATPWGPRWRGPVGRPQNTGMAILLTIVTCGIWQYVWTYRTHDDLQRYRGEGIGATVGLILSIFVGIAIFFTVPMEIEKMYQEEGLASPVRTTDGLWCLLPLAGPIIWFCKVQDALAAFWIARGAPPA